jgi:hypothetical protein
VVCNADGDVNDMPHGFPGLEADVPMAYIADDSDAATT